MLQDYPRQVEFRGFQASYPARVARFSPIPIAPHLHFLHTVRMCYSAIIKQQIKKLGFQYEARIDYESIYDIIHRRMTDPRIKVTKGFEEEFLHPENSEEREIRKLIEKYRELQMKDIEVELDKQEERLRLAERALELKETKRFLEEKRIATNHIERIHQKIKGLRRSELIPTDSRVFPMTFAPIIVQEDDKNVIKLARYHCRPADKPESIDQKYNGLYNARRDNLGNAFWKDLYLHKHAFFVVESFYENVEVSMYKPKPGPPKKNMVVQFNAPGNADLLIAALYDQWGSTKEERFYSFAALTHEPTPEISETGHDRLIVALQERNLDVWLNPERYGPRAIEKVLDDPAKHIYEHVLAGGEG